MKFSVMADEYAFISCEEQDLMCGSRGRKFLIDVNFQGEASPGKIRAAARVHLEEIRRIVAGARLVFVAAGLGGMVGSVLAPILVQTARENGAMALAIAAMPYGFEKNKHFYAGLALKQLKATADGVVIIDNSQLTETAPETPVGDLYAMINEKIGFALNKIIASSTNGDYPLGLNKFLGATSGQGYSLFSVGTAETNRVEEAVARAVRTLSENAEPDEAKGALLYIVGDTTLTPRDLENSVGVLTSLMSNTAMEIQYGFSTKGRGSSTAILLASGFSKTKFDHYDPLTEVLGDGVLDPQPEEALEMGFDRILPLEA
jgi:cell division protein FtsZ